MADERRKPQAPNGERPRSDPRKKPEAPQTADGKQGRKKKGTPRAMKILMTIIVGTGVILGEVAVSYIVVTRFILPQADANALEAGAGGSGAGADSTGAIGRPASTAVRRQRQAEGSEIQSNGLPNFNELGGVFTLSDVIINPAYSQGKRFFIVSIVVAFESEAVADGIRNREPILKDRIILHLGKKSFLWLANAANMELLRSELRSIVEGVAGVRDGIHIYFTKYVLQ